MIYIYEVSFFRFWLYVGFYVCLALAFGAGIYSAISADDAMTICQQTHSYDACFQALNR